MGQLRSMACLALIALVLEGCSPPTRDDRSRAECTTRRDCRQDRVCISGRCVAPPEECSSDRHCPNGTICSPEGECIEGCEPGAEGLSPDCPDGRLCNPDTRQCESCSSASLCPSGTICSAGACVEAIACGDEKDCSAWRKGSVCRDGACANCLDGEECGSGVCDATVGLCEGWDRCGGPEDCPGDDVCVDGACVDPSVPSTCEDRSDCEEGQACSGGECITPPLGVCDEDEDCPTGARCCLSDGICYETVGSGEVCDCTRPCAAEEGCFPGTCGEPPRRCRRSCDLGNFNCSIDTCTQADRAERCAPEDGKPAYCRVLPEAERTEENRGAVCAPADACSTLDQNCADFPLDRTLPVGAGNPILPHKCIPVSPSTNACVPAGPRAVDQSCGGSRCGEEALEMGCVKGATCVTLVDQYNQPVETKCLRLCTQDSHCGGFPRTCQTLYGAGWEPYSTGVCQ